MAWVELGGQKQLTAVSFALLACKAVSFFSCILATTESHAMINNKKERARFTQCLSPLCSHKNKGRENQTWALIKGRRWEAWVIQPNWLTVQKGKQKNHQWQRSCKLVLGRVYIYICTPLALPDPSYATLLSFTSWNSKARPGLR